MKKKLIKFLIVLYIVCFAGAGLLGKQAFAEDNKLDSGSFTYEVNHPENQKSTAGYFDLLMKPSQKQTVSITLKNPSDKKEVTVRADLSSAKTNANGVLEYGPAAIENDASLKYDFTEIVKGPKEVTLAPKEEKKLELEITMPTEQYDGFIVGGIQLTVKPTKEAEAEKKKQQGIANNYAFIIGMLLSESDAVVPAELTLNKVSAGLSNYRNAVFASISNTEMGFMKDMTIDMQVMAKGSDEVLYDTKKADMRMAPNSKIDFPLAMNGDEMVAGDYIAHILAKSGDRKWEWTEDFEITKEEADKYNKQDVTLTQERGINWQLIAMIVAGVVIFAVVIFIIVHQVNKKKAKKRKKGKKKSSNKK
ncbi:hypothetical protein BCR22_02240 [Enterococcus plantarum]|uniref:DUF916 and DUF3324 domain-containing protein n=1 Tax=Enterococcus plantarum TaxID=1077675 RepID=UPI00084DF158|nr:DUF916 and DUF3324 domain-containing protein [Enterococcus plantarum]OEG17498.1 hypothetical protein BCR22_02240 [Enterococcus plantarum]